LYSLPERFTLQQFHCDEDPAFGLVNIVDGADMRVIESGGSLRLRRNLSRAWGFFETSSGRNFSATWR